MFVGPENGNDFLQIVAVARVSLTFSAGTTSEDKYRWDPRTETISLRMLLWLESGEGCAPLGKSVSSRGG